MKPRFASSVVSREAFAEQVYHCRVAEYERLPVQWRGYVLARFPAETVSAVLERLDRGEGSSRYDPQGVFNAYQGQAPA
jgi:hypothetical protein